MGRPLTLILYLVEFCPHRVCAVGDLLQGIVAEQDRVGALQAEEGAHGQFADLDLCMAAGAHLDEVPPGARVAGDDDGRFGLVGEHGAGALLHFFAQVGFSLGGQYLRPGLLHLQQAIGQRGVLGGGAFDALEELSMEEIVLLVFGAFNEAQHAAGNEALAELRISKSGAVADEFVGHAARYAIE